MITEASNPSSGGVHRGQSIGEHGEGHRKFEGGRQSDLPGRPHKSGKPVIRYFLTTYPSSSARDREAALSTPYCRMSIAPRLRWRSAARRSLPSRRREGRRRLCAWGEHPGPCRACGERAQTNEPDANQQPQRCGRSTMPGGVRILASPLAARPETISIPSNRMEKATWQPFTSYGQRHPTAKKSR